ncbi:MAG: TraB/GumN family protein [Clostridia bacterium]|nr:TraB/GumN family protein [Clostridia bacterium]
MKRIAAWMAVMLMLFAGAARAESTPLLYRVTDDAGHDLYLLGTVHVGWQEMYPLSEAVENAWQAADVLAVEADVYEMTQNPVQVAQYALSLMYQDGDTADRHLSPETYALGVAHLGLTETMLRRMRPVAWASLAEEACYTRLGCDGDNGIDHVLLKRAHEEGKPIDELEGMAFQIALMLALPDAVCDDTIAAMLSDPEGMDAELARMLSAWARGDEAEFTAWIAQDINDYPPEKADVYQTYNAMLYDDRNAAFTLQAVDYLQSGQTALIAVGAAHVVGEGGIVDRLAKAGYSVQEIGR